MNSVSCTPLAIEYNSWLPSPFFPDPLKTAFLGVGTEQVRRGYGAGLSESPIATS